MLFFSVAKAQPIMKNSAGKQPRIDMKKVHRRSIGVTDIDGFSVAELVTVACYLQQTKGQPADLEDIAVQAAALAPGRFSWRKYPDQIHLNAVRMALVHAMEGRTPRVSRVGKTEFKLTARGLAWARKVVTDRSIPRPSPRRSIREQRAGDSTSQARLWVQHEGRRLRSQPAFEKFLHGLSDSVTRNEAEQFFRLDEYVSRETRRARVEQLGHAFAADSELGPAIRKLAHLVL